MKIDVLDINANTDVTTWFMYPKRKLAVPCMTYVPLLSHETAINYLSNGIILRRVRSVQEEKWANRDESLLCNVGESGGLELFQPSQCGEGLREIGCWVPSTAR